MIFRLIPLALMLSGALCVAAASDAAPAAKPAVTVTVDEGTSMAVTVSPDGKMLAMDLQGSIWVMPASGGRATRITDPFNDVKIYCKAPLYLLRGELIDPMDDVTEAERQRV